MRKSRVNKASFFDENQWVISIMNNGGEGTVIENKLFGHAVLLVEGLISSSSSFPQLFIGQYDIAALPTNEPGFFEFLKNTKGKITKIRTIETNDYTHPKGDTFYRKTKSRSFTVAKENAQDMIQSIKDDQDHTQKAQQGQVEYLMFQKYGSSGGVLQFLLSDQEEGINCAEWCLKKLAVAGIYLEEKPKPEYVASSNCILS